MFSVIPSMKSSTSIWIILLFSSILITEGFSSYRELIPGKLRTSQRQHDAYSSETCDGTRMTICNDCSEIKICISSTDDSRNPTQPCPPGRPYCGTSRNGTRAVCRTRPDQSMDRCSETVPSDDFYCTGTGFYPDAHSCQAYHYCTGEGAIPESYDCPEGYRYNSRVNFCWRSSFVCPVVNCNPWSNRVFSVHPMDYSYYVHCLFDYTKKPPKLMQTHVFGCGKGSFFNPTISQCVFRCLAEGLYVNTVNPRQYYRCYKVNERFIAYDKLYCETDEVFDELNQRCVGGSDTSGSSEIIDVVTDINGSSIISMELTTESIKEEVLMSTTSATVLHVTTTAPEKDPSVSTTQVVFSSTASNVPNAGIGTTESSIALTSSNTGIGEITDLVTDSTTHPSKESGTEQFTESVAETTVASTQSSSPLVENATNTDGPAELEVTTPSKSEVIAIEQVTESKTSTNDYASMSEVTTSSQNGTESSTASVDGSTVQHPEMTTFDPMIETETVTSYNGNTTTSEIESTNPANFPTTTIPDETESEEPNVPSSSTSSPSSSSTTNYTNWESNTTVQPSQSGTTTARPYTEISSTVRNTTLWLLMLLCGNCSQIELNTGPNFEVLHAVKIDGFQ